MVVVRSAGRNEMDLRDLARVDMLFKDWAMAAVKHACCYALSLAFTNERETRWASLNDFLLDPYTATCTRSPTHTLQT